MNALSKILPLIAVMAATPVFAATDPHAEHRSDAKPVAGAPQKPADAGCPMHAKMADAAAKGAAHMHCMQGAKPAAHAADAAPKPPADAASHDHDHAQPK